MLGVNTFNPVYVLLHGLKPIMKTNLWEKDIFSMKRLFEEIRVTHGELRRHSRRKHTLNKNKKLHLILFKKYL